MKLSIKPDSSELPDLRNKTRMILEECSLPKNQIESLEMVAADLTENAIKFGSFKDNETIDFTIDIGGSDVTMEVKYKIIPGSVNLKLLDSKIQWLRGFQNPYQAYLEKNNQTTTKYFTDNESSFGLERIAYDGNSVLDYYLDEDNILAISAVYKLKK